MRRIALFTLAAVLRGQEQAVERGAACRVDQEGGGGRGGKAGVHLVDLPGRGAALFQQHHRQFVQAGIVADHHDGLALVGPGLGFGQDLLGVGVVERVDHLDARGRKGALHAVPGLLGALGGDSTGGGGPGDMSEFNSIFDFSCRDGYLSKKLNKEKFDALKNDPQIAQMKQASQMGIEINYTSTLSLPRPVKKVDNPLAKLSDDKKTVTMKFNLVDVFDHPEQFEYTVEY